MDPYDSPACGKYKQYNRLKTLYIGPWVVGLSNVRVSKSDVVITRECANRANPAQSNLLYTCGREQTSSRAYKKYSGENSLLQAKAKPFVTFLCLKHLYALGG